MARKIAFIMVFLYITIGASEREYSDVQQYKNETSKGLMGVICGTVCIGAGSVESLLRCVMFLNDSKTKACLSVAGNCFGANGIDRYCISNYALCGAGCLTCAICGILSIPDFLY